MYSTLFTPYYLYSVHFGLKTVHAHAAGVSCIQHILARHSSAPKGGGWSAHLRGDHLQCDGRRLHFGRCVAAIVLHLALPEVFTLHRRFLSRVPVACCEHPMPMANWHWSCKCARPRPRQGLTMGEVDREKKLTRCKRWTMRRPPCCCQPTTGRRRPKTAAPAQLIP